MTVTLPPCLSRSWSAASIAFSSNGLIMASTPSLIRVLVSGFILTCVVPGDLFDADDDVHFYSGYFLAAQLLDQLKRYDVALDLVRALRISA